MKQVIVGLIVWVCLVLSPGIFFAGERDVDIIPPEILKLMDKDILSGKRPVIAKIRQGEIFGLRKNPKIDADFVTFDFDVDNLSLFNMITY